jgi:ankyrin repeat protein
MDTELRYAASRNDFANVSRLIESKANVNNNCDSERLTPLIHSARHGHLSIVQLLIKSNANVNAIDIYSMAAITWSAQNGFLTCVESLIEAKANICAVSLHCAASGGHTDIVKFLHSRGSSVNYKCPIITAALINRGRVQENLIKLLIELKANVDAVDKQGETALIMIAIMKNHPSTDPSVCTTLLLDAGADLNIRSHKNQRAIDYTLNPKMKKLLEDEPSRRLMLNERRCKISLILLANILPDLAQIIGTYGCYDFPR